MTYLVLARKWRPRSFDTLVGQDHVVRALTHALSTQRLHHAWLFTGTRGVGKTTLSRILAKSLNCHTGITATPCGECAACTEIDAGRFVDYIELDAASNRGVDEMTQLLEQAVYAPSNARFKVYMIDEVHMLSGHAFNAMLKTLEEPPAHVKFILATTDPQKIPATVLSRCLQFNLKQMAPDSIISYLQHVLAEEGIQYDVAALRLLAQAAAGSMRDALSLTDQAIAYSAGNLTLESIQGMLGTIDQGHLIALLRALGAGDARGMLDVADNLAMRGLSYSAALADLAELLSRIAIEQRIPGSVPADDPLCEDLQALAQSLHPDAVQLFYSVAVHSRQELSLAPDEYAGFVMACLRMLSLLPEGTVAPPAAPPAGAAPDAKPDVSAAQPAASEAGPAASAASKIPPTAPASEAEPATPVSADVDAVAPGDNVVPAGHSAPRVDAVSTRDGASPEDVAPNNDVAPADEIASSKGAGPVPASAAASPSQSASELATAPASASASASAGASGGASASASAGASADASTGAPATNGALPATEVPPWEDVPMDDGDFILDTADVDDEFETLGADPAAEAALAQLAPRSSNGQGPKLANITAADWPTLVQQLPLTGAAEQLARQTEWLGVDGNRVRLRVGIQTLAEISARSRFCTVLSEHFGTVIDVDFEVGETGEGTAHAVEQAHLEKLQEQAEQAVQNDPLINALIREFDGQVVSGSIRPVI